MLAVATREERNAAGCVGAAAGVVRQGERGTEGTERDNRGASRRERESGGKKTIEK